MGTIKNAIYKIDNGTDFDEIHFKTKAAQVFCNDGKTVESQLAELRQYVKYRFSWVNITTATDSLNTTIPYPEGSSRGSCFVIGGYVTKANNVYNNIPSNDASIYYNASAITLAVSSSTFQGASGRLLWAIVI
ncbi:MULTISPECIES: hypothetical protein [unclassified Clostridium]|uniref:hypothetical protein n=1 Tax=unclassified Clostridium TaxID=2614128 RepID=UPI003216E7D5